MVKDVGKYPKLLKTVTMTTEEDGVQNIDDVEAEKLCIMGLRKKRILP